MAMLQSDTMLPSGALQRGDATAEGGGGVQTASSDTLEDDTQQAQPTAFALEFVAGTAHDLKGVLAKARLRAVQDRTLHNINHAIVVLSLAIAVLTGVFILA